MPKPASLRLVSFLGESSCLSLAFDTASAPAATAARQQQEAATAAQKFKLDFNTVASGQHSANVENLAAQAEQLSLDIGRNSLFPGVQSDLVLEKQRAQLMKTQLQESRHKTAISLKTAPVPPVGRNSVAIKTKVFDLPFERSRKSTAGGSYLSLVVGTLGCRWK